MSYTLIERRELTSESSSISFDNIPQFYSDLIILGSGRTTDTGNGNLNIRFNADNGSNYFQRMLFTENGGAPTSASGSGTFMQWFYSNSANSTANSFSNFYLYIPNYTSSSSKSVNMDHTTEHNGTSPFIQGLTAGSWNGTAAITSLAISQSSGNFVPSSSISLYGINRQQAIGAPKAVGGAISFANGYWVHTFTGSGSFVPQEDLQVDALVVAGGGGGPSLFAQSGAGAGGLLVGKASVFSANQYAVVVGAGGTGGTNTTNYSVGSNGGNSSFLSLTSTGGGFGGGGGLSAGSGGSGGGSWSIATPGTGVSGQGFNGSIGSTDNTTYTNGGAGGGAGGAASNAVSNSTGSIGGTGVLNSFNGSSTYYAGGGSGAIQSGSNPAAPLGGTRGSTSTPNPGAANTGAGAGGGTGSIPGAAGGSGIVIIRYKA